jgi:DNA-binding response OmpR family regulator
MVESQAADRERGAKALSDAGYEVVQAASAEEALTALGGAESPIDLLVTDVALPGVTGLGLAAQLHAARPDVPVLFVTGASDARLDVLQIFEHGDILVKPFAPADLLAKVREAFCLAAS